MRKLQRTTILALSEQLFEYSCFNVNENFNTKSFSTYSNIKSKSSNKSSERWRILLCTIILITIFGSAILILNKHVRNQRKYLGAIVSNGARCGSIGKYIIDEGGSAVDSIIAVLVCEGAILPHSVGIGGGFIATIYDKQQGNVMKNPVIARNIETCISKKLEMIPTEFDSEVHLKLWANVFNHFCGDRMHQLQ
uniref:Gamma-glutamyltransferase n=1 Tax=Megaselia scalaris TaxID=36166 RepID=T1GFS2_MEGSC